MYLSKMASPLLTTLFLMFTQLLVGSMQQSPTGVHLNTAHPSSLKDHSGNDDTSDGIVLGEAVLHLKESNEDFVLPVIPPQGNSVPDDWSRLPGSRYSTSHSTPSPYGRQAPDVKTDNPTHHDHTTQQDLLQKWQAYQNYLLGLQQQRQGEGKIIPHDGKIQEGTLYQLLAQQKYLADLQNHLQQEIARANSGNNQVHPGALSQWLAQQKYLAGLQHLLQQEIERIQSGNNQGPLSQWLAQQKYLAYQHQRQLEIARRISWNNQIYQGALSQWLAHQKYLADLQRQLQYQNRTISGNNQLNESVFPQWLAQQKYLAELQRQLQYQESLKYQRLIPEVWQSLPVRSTYSTHYLYGYKPQGIQSTVPTGPRYEVSVKNVRTSHETGLEKYYKLFKLQLNHQEALAFCNSKKMSLASIQNQEEQDVLQQMIKLSGLPKPNVWTSGTYIPTHTNFFWSTTGHPFIYTNWAKDQPNHKKRPGEDEVCVRLEENNGYKWHDSFCSEKSYVACEFFV